MKRTLICLAFMACFQPFMCHAQNSGEKMKERKELRKMSKGELNEKATKAARKEAKKLAKEGWASAPGALARTMMQQKCRLWNWQNKI